MRSAKRGTVRKHRLPTQLRKWATLIIGEDRARYLTLGDLRHAALTDLVEVTQIVGAVAAEAGHRDLRTTSRYFNVQAPRGDRCPASTDGGRPPA